MAHGAALFHGATITPGRVFPPSLLSLSIRSADHWHQPQVPGSARSFVRSVVVHDQDAICQRYPATGARHDTGSVLPARLRRGLQYRTALDWTGTLSFQEHWNTLNSRRLEHSDFKKTGTLYSQEDSKRYSQKTGQIIMPCRAVTD